tara:strand:- start:421 stop:606 length:186 start_codon:yes stop_codon:yes gene_type:complete
MQLTKLEKKCLREALEYAICDYEENLIHLTEYDFEKSTLEEQRQVLKGWQRVQAKLLKEVA